MDTLFNCGLKSRVNALLFGCRIKSKKSPSTAAHSSATKHDFHLCRIVKIVIHNLSPYGSLHIAEYDSTLFCCECERRKREKKDELNGKSKKTRNEKVFMTICLGSSEVVKSEVCRRRLCRTILNENFKRLERGSESRRF